MASEKVETVIAGNYVEMEREEGSSKSTKSKFSNFLWHGGSVYDAWFSCASNQAIYSSMLTGFSGFIAILQEI
jgi:auxin influx carrier (AUX1 LAX family)